MYTYLGNINILQIYFYAFVHLPLALKLQVEVSVWQYGVDPEQAAELPHLHVLVAASQVSAAVFPTHVAAVPHIQTPATQVSPDIEHVITLHGSRMFMTKNYYFNILPSFGRKFV